MGDLLSPQDRVRQNQAVVASVAKLVQDNFIVRVQGRGYLMVQGAQAIGTAMGYTTAIESMRHVPAGDDGIAGWLNGELIHSLDAVRAVKADEDQFSGTLKAGQNVVVCRIKQYSLHWGGCLSIRSPSGGPALGVSVVP